MPSRDGQRILLTHTPEIRALYYREGPQAALAELAPVRFNDMPDDLDADALIEAARGVPIIVAHRATPVPAKVLAALPDLVAVVRSAVDIRNIDIGAASEAGVLVTHASPGFVPAVAELAVAMMIDLGRGIGSYAGEYRAGRPPAQRMGRQLSGSMLGILGYGAIGAYLARLGLALGMEVLAADPFVQQAEAGVTLASMADVLARADFVVCLVVANDSTDNLMNATTFAQMKRGSFFVNMSRGALVDEAALEAALDSGHLAGAAMDVGRWGDQMPQPRLAARPNVVATPHIGGLTQQAVDHQAFETTRQVAAILRGEAPPGSLNAAAAIRLARMRG